MCESSKQGTLAGLLEAGYHSLVWLSVTDIPPEVTESKGYPEKESKAWLSWQKRSHFWPKPFCDFILATTLALEQVSVINDLKETEAYRNKPLLGKRSNNTKIMHHS